MALQEVPPDSLDGVLGGGADGGGGEECGLEVHVRVRAQCAQVRAAQGLRGDADFEGRVWCRGAGEVRDG